ncbi:MAG: P-type DNA transfer ATPase VirB11 [Pseudomonadales bacterium]
MAAVNSIKASNYDHKSDGVLPEDASVRVLLSPLNKYLQREGATELCVNAPGAVFVEIEATFERFEAPELTMSYLMGLVTAISHFATQGINAETPIMSATLPDGERIQIIIPPALEQGSICLCIRVPSKQVFSLGAYRQKGYFDRYLWAESKDEQNLYEMLNFGDKTLLQLMRDKEIEEFLVQAVKLKKTIAVVGDTGSGKTTFMKTLCQQISCSERLVTIEDVRELFLDKHDNRVHLLYSKGGQGLAKVTPADLISGCMRLNPSRVLLAELRGSEAFDFLKLLLSGHAGSITSYHAESCALAAERYVLMCKEHPQAGIYSGDELKRVFALTVDILIHVEARVIEDDEGNPVAKDRYIAEISYDPIAKLESRFGNSEVRRAS